MRHRWVMISLLFCAALASAQSTKPGGKDRLIAQNSSRQVSLVELYSSEGCSSCPPADAWISKLRNKEGLWTAFIPVVFHVDYWNYLGWKDSFSEHQMTERQIAISKQWPKPSVYTPAIVVNGQEWRDWSRREIPSSTAEAPVRLKIFEVAPLRFRVELDGGKGPQAGKKSTIHIAILGNGLKSSVTAGENQGQTLEHNFVVLDWSSKEVTTQSSFEFQTKIPSQKHEQLAVVAWIENVGNPTPVQAVGGYL